MRSRACAQSAHAPGASAGEGVLGRGVLHRQLNRAPCGGWFPRAPPRRTWGQPPAARRRTHNWPADMTSQWALSDAQRADTVQRVAANIATMAFFKVPPPTPFYVPATTPAPLPRLQPPLHVVSCTPASQDGACVPAGAPPQGRVVEEADAQAQAAAIEKKAYAAAQVAARTTTGDRPEAETTSNYAR